jgi:hypothetical protein
LLSRSSGGPWGHRLWVEVKTVGSGQLDDVKKPERWWHYSSDSSLYAARLLQYSFRLGTGDSLSPVHLVTLLVTAN